MPSSGNTAKIKISDSYTVRLKNVITNVEKIWINTKEVTNEHNKQCARAVQISGR